MLPNKITLDTLTVSQYERLISKGYLVKEILAILIENAPADEKDSVASEFKYFRKKNGLIERRHIKKKHCSTFLEIAS